MYYSGIYLYIFIDKYITIGIRLINIIINNFTSRFKYELIEGFIKIKTINFNNFKTFN
jgi:hypothetical protein